MYSSSAPFPYFKGDDRVTVLPGGKAEGEEDAKETEERSQGTEEGGGKRRRDEGTEEREPEAGGNMRVCCILGRREPRAGTEDYR